MRNSLILAIALSGMATHSLADVVASQKVEVEELVTTTDGKSEVKRVKADMVEPGETLFYSLDFVNKGKELAENMVLVMNVPTEVTFVEGSIAGASANVTFSADGGQTFVARGRLTVNDAGGSRAATGNDITNIKFVLRDPVAPNGRGKVSFRAILK